MTATPTNPAYVPVYEMLLEAAEHLDALRPSSDGGVDPHVTAATHALRFAAAILQPAVPGTTPPPFPHDTARLLELLANWREAALGLGEFAPAAPALRLVRGMKN